MLSGTKTAGKDAAVGGGSSSICLHGRGWVGVSGSRGDKESLDLKQTDRRSGGSRRLDADATAEERQGGLESISRTAESTLVAQPSSTAQKLAAGHT